MKKLKEWLDVQTIEAAKNIGVLIGLVPATIWLFVFLELFLFAICKHTRLEIFVLQFPITLWVLVSKKDK
jgi:hypothetical protein